MELNIDNHNQVSTNESIHVKGKHSFESIYVKGKHSFEDFKDLIGNLLVIDTFLLGFTLAYGNSIDYNDLISSDQRYMTIWQDSKVNDWFSAQLYLVYV